ncbi:hypothetical protein C2S51_007345 [Perilla frutescens var. frutescens]|nr:hypothetical protein C2S51_007345 [Perilla frutescens var. frutescens]
MEKLTDYTCNTEYTAAWNKLMSDQDEFMKVVHAAFPLAATQRFGEINTLHLWNLTSDVVHKAYDLKMGMVAYWDIIRRIMVDNMVLHLLFNTQKLDSKEMQRGIINELMRIQGNWLGRMLEDFRADNSKIKKTFEVEDQYRVDKQYQLKNSVYLKLQAYWLNSVSLVKKPVLTFRCYRPCTILKKIRSCHLWFRFTPELKECLFNLVPTTILDTHSTKVGRKMVNQFRVYWERGKFDPASWEYEAFIRRRFPNLNPCGQGFLKGGGNVVDKVVEGLGKSPDMVEDFGKNSETGNWEMWYRESFYLAFWGDLNIVKEKFPTFDPCGQGSQNGKGNVVNTTTTTEIERQQQEIVDRLVEVSEIRAARGKTHFQDSTCESNEK